mgnify:CR=1 FL=1
MKVTDKALQKILKILDDQDVSVKGLRITAESISPLKVDYRIQLVDDDSVHDDDEINSFSYEDKRLDVYVDADSQHLVKDVEVDFIDTFAGEGFKINAPSHIPDHMDKDVVTAIESLLKEKINPSIASHGGRVSLVDVKDNIMFVQMEGGCQGCAASAVTLRQGIEATVKNTIPQIEEIIDITDHASGKNPYYKTSSYEPEE